MSTNIIQKLWSSHRVRPIDAHTDLIYIDRIFLHERTGSIALKSIERSGRPVRNPRSVFATIDHIVDTLPGRGDQTMVPSGEMFIKATREATRLAGIHLFDVNDPDQGIVHVVSPELGIALPGVSLVCPDSHTGTVGALGALAWGVGTTEVEHALVTQTLPVKRLKNMNVVFHGSKPDNVTAKDMILFLIGRYGAAAGVGYAIEFSGQAIRELEMEARFTVCNMAVEFGAWTGVIGPDDKTIDYVSGRRYAPTGSHWEAAVDAWTKLRSDDDAVFDKTLEIDTQSIKPQITWGTSPQHVMGIGDAVPEIDKALDRHGRETVERAMDYMQVRPGQLLGELQVDAAFIGSCTNSRISDLRAAAAVLKGRRIAAGIRALCVPGSSAVKRQAEDEGLDKVFEQAGFEWRESGCSLCFYAGGESFGPGKRIVSSTNRNFEGRQGIGARTHITSPETVAATAVLGRIGHVGELQR